MTATDILNTLRERGVTLRVDEQGRIVAKPLSAIDDGLRREVKAHKAELLTLLQPVCPVWEAWQRGEGGIPPLSTCLACGYPSMPSETVTVDGERWQRWQCPRCGKSWRVPLSDEPLPPCPRCGGGMDAAKPTKNHHASIVPLLRLTCVVCEFVTAAYPPGTWTACWRCDSDLERRQVADDWLIARCLRCQWAAFERNTAEAGEAA